MVTDGRFDIPDVLPGDYEVTVTGPAHVTHKNLRITVTQADNKFSFSVLAWNSGRFGAIYDRAFDVFFDLIARRYPYNPIEIYQDILKWRDVPQELYVVEEHLSRQELDEFLAILREVNDESIPDMFGGRSGPLPLVVGPAQDAWRAGVEAPGKIVLRFYEGPSYAGRSCPSANERTFNCGFVKFGTHDFVATSRFRKKHVIAHEIFHVAFASHPLDYNMQMYGSLMGGAGAGTALSKEDRLASWIVYHNDTHPGNRHPDTNPYYRR